MSRNLAVLGDGFNSLAALFAGIGVFFVGELQLQLLDNPIVMYVSEAASSIRQSKVYQWQVKYPKEKKK